MVIYAVLGVDFQHRPTGSWLCQRVPCRLKPCSNGEVQPVYPELEEDPSQHKHLGNVMRTWWFTIGCWGTLFSDRPTWKCIKGLNSSEIFWSCNNGLRTATPPRPSNSRCHFQKKENVHEESEIRDPSWQRQARLQDIWRQFVARKRLWDNNGTIYHINTNIGGSINGGTPKWMVNNGKPYYFILFSCMMSAICARPVLRSCGRTWTFVAGWQAWHVLETNLLPDDISCMWRAPGLNRWAKVSTATYCWNGSITTRRDHDVSIQMSCIGKQGFHRSPLHVLCFWSNFNIRNPGLWNGNLRPWLPHLRAQQLQESAHNLGRGWNPGPWCELRIRQAVYHWTRLASTTVAILLI